jgi:hypothetical protein
MALSTSMDRIIAIAERSRDVLCGKLSKWSRATIYDEYRRAAVQAGFVRRSAEPLLPEVETAMLNFYGDSFLRAIDCQFVAGSNSNWVRNIFRPAPKKTFHSLQHILVQIFLNPLPSSASSIPLFGLGPWKCPNIFMEHPEKYPIHKVSIREDASGKKVASAKCTCGTAFTFSKLCPQDDRMPSISQVRQLGNSWRLEITRRRNARSTTRTIAREMGLSRYAVERALMNGCVSQDFCCSALD